jgi:hypothetical protein
MENPTLINPVSDLHKAALSCVARKWYIFPLLEQAKEPNLSLCPRWSQESSNDPQKINEWWTKYPNSNIGIDLGKSNITVLDFDRGEAPANLGLDGFGVTSGKGQHWYFQGTTQQCDMHFGGKHIGEVKSGGGYIVGPKSLHPNGKTYQPINNHSLEPLPAELLQKLTNKTYQPCDATPGGPKIPHGSHDKELHRIAGKLRGYLGLEEEGIYAALVEICEKRCEGYGSDYLQMCRKHAREICKKPVNPDMTATVGTPKQEEVKPDPTNWRDYYRSFSQLEDGDVKMILNGFAPEGVILIGGLAGQGKTLVALSIVKALTTGEPFLGRFMTEDITPVIYLIPESSSRAFKMRCKAFGIPDDEQVFLCRTISEGKTLMLDDPMLIEAVQHLKPVIILDTLPRFNESGDENDASGNKKLVDDMTNLRALGAVAIIGLHHSTKSSADAELTLENCLRGTGDFGAMADAVYAIRRDRNLYSDGAGPNEIEVRCVKPRDFEPPAPFKIAASYRKDDGTITSYIDEQGDFHLVETAAVIESEDRAFLKAINDQPNISAEHLAEDLGISDRKLRRLQRRLGYVKTSGRFGKWIPKAQLINPDPAVLDPTYAESKAREAKLDEPVELFELK